MTAWAVVLEFKRLKQEDPGFEASLYYIEKPYIKNKLESNWVHG